MPIESVDVDVRAGTAAEFAASSLVAGAGELLVATDTGDIRVGDGTNVFSALRRRDGAFARGNAVLVAGTKATTVTGVATGDIVLATVRTLGTVTSAKGVLAVASTNTVTITSSDNTDTSNVAYVVFKA